MKLGWLLLCFASLSFAAEQGGVDPAVSAFPEQFSPAEAERMILVGFSDQSIERTSAPMPLSGYRRRGDYQSSTWSRRTSAQIAEDYHLQKLEEWPMTEVGVQCVVYKVLSAGPVADTLARMAKDSRIKIVQKMHWFITQGRHEYNDPYFKLQSNLHAMQLDRVHDLATGRNVTIGMIDTGVDSGHPDLSGQISRQENFASRVSPEFAGDIHGTAVAGVMIARKDNGVGIAGIAPDANLVALKACWPAKADAMAAACNSYTLALAVNTAIKAGVDILNMSLTGPEDPLLELLLNKAIEQGIIVVAADTGGTQAQDNFPATLNHVIPVQALSRSKDPADNSGGRVEASAENVLTTLPHGAYDFISGSSIAAAEVSGIVALLLELKPGLSPQNIKALLLKSQQESLLQAGGAEKTGGFSGINANHAVASLCKNANCGNERFAFASSK
ncbi:S8 family peptidase [Methylomicrobium lacus]|uniref:S8 family peptidase n=1 Tax=Methylomicrobium lacus TaxID=136992 RepID=UPI00045EB642|nr:S8 family serine peptidase [Methylomicrobium lacus]